MHFPQSIDLNGFSDTNAILDNTYEGVIIDIQSIDNVKNVGSIECMLCKKIMQLLIIEVKDITDDVSSLTFCSIRLSS